MRVPAIVSLRDVPATIADMIGARDASWTLPGRSLSPRWSGASTPDTLLAEVDWLPREGKPWYPARRGNVRSLIAWPYQLIMVGPVAELYDIDADPGQHRDLAQQPEFATRRDSLVLALRRWREDAVPAKRQ